MNLDSRKRVPDQPLLSVIVPAYNESRTLSELLERISQAPPAKKQVIVTDDGSTDDTAAVLEQSGRRMELSALRHHVNCGKGRAIRTALAAAQGWFTIVQDADLEYDPRDYALIVKTLASGSADLVLGSRYLAAGGGRGARLFRLGVGVLNVATWILYGLKLTDEATCYKAIRTETLRRMDLQCEQFEFCPEVIAKACRMGLRIVEVPISYHPRTAKEGKKIRLRDGISALRTLWRWRKWVPGEGEKKLPVDSCQVSVVGGQLSVVSSQLPVGGELLQR